MAGLGGALSGYRFGSVTPLYFGAFVSLGIAAIAYLGGISSVPGAFAAGLLASGGVAQLVLTDWVHVPGTFVNLASGVGLIATAIANPDGIAGGVARLAARVRALAPTPAPVGRTGGEGRRGRRTLAVLTVTV